MATEDYMAGTYSQLVEVTQQKVRPPTERKATKATPADKPRTATPLPSVPSAQPQPGQQPQEAASTQALGSWTLDLNDPTGIPRTFPFSSQDVEALNDLKTLMRRQLGIETTNNDIMRAALHIVFDDYLQKGQDSLIAKKILTKRAK